MGASGRRKWCCRDRCPRIIISQRGSQFSLADGSSSSTGSRAPLLPAQIAPYFQQQQYQICAQSPGWPWLWGGASRNCLTAQNPFLMAEEQQHPSCSFLGWLWGHGAAGRANEPRAAWVSSRAAGRMCSTSGVPHSSAWSPWEENAAREAGG